MLATTTSRLDPEIVWPDDREHQRIVEETIRQRLAGCPYAFYFNRITCCYEQGRLTLSGCLPSFYMKQMLQTILRDIEHVTQIVNNVAVVSATGLSSEPAKS